MLMDILGILIGFIGIMLLFSLLITAVVHGAQAALQLRFKNMKSVINAFFDHIDVLDEPCKTQLADKLNGRSAVTLYATALPLDILGNRLKLSSIGKKELIAIVQSIGGMIPEHTKRIEKEINEHFDTLEEIMSQRFKQWMHQLSIILAFVICFVFQLNCFSLLDKLNQDSLYRQQAMQISQEITAESSPDQLENKLMALSFTIEPDTWYQYYLSLEVSSIFNWIGIIFSSILISLGAPFWFNRLRDVVSLRDKLSSIKK